MPPAFNLSQDQTLQFNLCVWTPSWKGIPFSLITLAGIDKTSCSLIFLCFLSHEHGTNRFVSSIFFRGRLFARLRFSPRSRLSVRCLVFKELSLPQKWRQEANFIWIISSLSRAFEKFFIFLLPFSLLEHKKESLFRLVFVLAFKRGCELWTYRFDLSSFFRFNFLFPLSDSLNYLILQKKFSKINKCTLIAPLFGLHQRDWKTKRRHALAKPSPFPENESDLGPVVCIM